MSDQQKRRPPRTVTIADCSSCIILANPAPACPHGLEWRRTDFDTLPEDARQLVCAEPQCTAIEYQPHRGESITLKVARSYAEAEELSARFRGGLDIDAAQQRTVTQILDDMWPVVADQVTAWTWTGDEDGRVVLPIPSVDLEQCRAAMELGELLWIGEALIARGDPRQVVRSLGNTGGGSPTGS